METAAALSAGVRTALGKGPARQLRFDGLIPAVCYGNSVEPKHVSVNPDDVVERLTGEYGKNALFKLMLSDGTEHLVRVGDYQRDPVKRGLIHVDFLVVDTEKAMVAEVPLELQGDAKGVKAGGRLRQLRWTVKVLARPQDVPAKLVLDVTEMTIGQVEKVSALKTGDDIEIFFKQDYAIAQVFLPRGEEEDEETDEDEEAAEAPAAADA